MLSHDPRGLMHVCRTGLSGSRQQCARQARQQPGSQAHNPSGVLWAKARMAAFEISHHQLRAQWLLERVAIKGAVVPPAPPACVHSRASTVKLPHLCACRHAQCPSHAHTHRHTRPHTSRNRRAREGGHAYPGLRLSVPAKLQAMARSGVRTAQQPRAVPSHT